jgi:hypothetical protein
VKCFRIFGRLHNEWKLEKLVYKGYAMNEKIGEKGTKVTQMNEELGMKNWGEMLPHGWKITQWFKKLNNLIVQWIKRVRTKDENLIWGGTFIHCATF